MNTKTLHALQYLYNHSHFHRVKFITLLSFFKLYQEEYDFLLANDYIIHEGKYIRITNKGLLHLSESHPPLSPEYRLKLLKEKLSVYHWKKLAIIITISSTIIGFIIEHGKSLLDLYQSLFP